MSLLNEHGITCVKGQQRLQMSKGEGKYGLQESQFSKLRAVLVAKLSPSDGAGNKFGGINDFSCIMLASTRQYL